MLPGRPPTPRLPSVPHPYRLHPCPVSATTIPCSQLTRSGISPLRTASRLKRWSRPTPRSIRSAYWQGKHSLSPRNPPSCRESRRRLRRLHPRRPAHHCRRRPPRPPRMQGRRRRQPTRLCPSRRRLTHLRPSRRRSTPPSRRGRPSRRARTGAACRGGRRTGTQRLAGCDPGADQWQADCPGIGGAHLVTRACPRGAGARRRLCPAQPGQPRRLGRREAGGKIGTGRLRGTYVQRKLGQRAKRRARVRDVVERAQRPRPASPQHPELPVQRDRDRRRQGILGLLFHR